MKRITLKSPAKLNLYLKVLGKRKDGYHEIETLFERIDLCDEITLIRRPSGIAIQVGSAAIPMGWKNAAYKAAKLLKEKYGVKSGISVRIKKRIPVAAGLGGGSSNAAAVLAGLVELWNLKVSNSELAELSGEIGADVPFFLSGRSYAIGKGRGDEIFPLRKKKIYWHLLLNPGVKVPTKKVYEEADVPLSNPLPAGERKKVRGISGNALYECAVRVCPEINRAADILRKAGAKDVYMTGSGPTLFTIHQREREALELLRRLPRCNSSSTMPRGYRYFVAKTL